MNEHTSQEALSRKEREKRARQQDILNAARELFAAQGFRETTLDQIAQKAEFGKGTLYNYFASKDEIFREIIDQAIEHAIALARESAATPGDLRLKLTHYASATMRYFHENGELLHAIFHELHGGRKTDAEQLRSVFRRSREVTAIMGAAIQAEMDAGTVSPGDPAAFVAMLDDLVRGHAGREVTMQQVQSPEDLDAAADRMVEVLLNGITVRHSKG
jgi:TetR/AcrR family transcriptional regulator, repressor of fatR-cypB operon